MAYAYAVIVAFFGMVVGSFLNVVIDRLPAGQSLAFPPSHCPACQRRLSPGDLFPIFSYLILRGRCRSCGSSIPRRVLLVEVITPLLYVFLWFWYGSTIEFAVMVFYTSLFIVITFIDLEQRLILNRIVYPAFLPTLAIAGLLTPGIWWGLAGGALAFVIMLLIAILSRGGMGFGDVKLAALLGIMVGFPNILLVLFLAVVVGGIVAVILLIFRRKGRKEAIPFGPFLCLGGMLTLVWGQDLINFYLRISGLS